MWLQVAANASEWQTAALLLGGWWHGNGLQVVVFFSHKTFFVILTREQFTCAKLSKALEERVPPQYLFSLSFSLGTLTHVPP